MKPDQSTRLAIITREILILCDEAIESASSPDDVRKLINLRRSERDPKNRAEIEAMILEAISGV